MNPSKLGILQATSVFRQKINVIAVGLVTPNGTDIPVREEHRDARQYAGGTRKLCSMQHLDTLFSGDFGPLVSTGLQQPLIHQIWLYLWNNTKMRRASVAMHVNTGTPEKTKQQVQRVHELPEF